MNRHPTLVHEDLPVSVNETTNPPDRSTSAPPALEIATENVFAFKVEYAQIFSDIRTHEVNKTKISLDSLLTTTSTTKTKKKESLMQLTTKKYWNYQSNISFH